MLFSWPKTFIDSIKPLVYMNCHAGIGFFRQPHQSDAAYFFMKFYTVVFAVGNWIAIYIGLSALLLTGNVSLMVSTMYKVLILTNSCIVVISPFLVWHRTKVLRHCLQQMQILDVTFPAILGVQNEYRRQYICSICQGMAIVLVMLLMGIYEVILHINEELQTTILRIPTQHYPIFVMLTLDMNFCTFVGYLKKKFRDLNDRLIILGKKPPTFFPDASLIIIPQNIAKITPGNQKRNTETGSSINDERHLLKEIQNAYLEVCKLSGKINFAFGLQNLLSTGISFVMITGLLYFSYNAFANGMLTNGSLKKVILTTFRAVVFILRIWIVNHYCWSVSNEAARTGEVIYELLNFRADEEFRKEIQKFALQMLQNPVRFDACGFFTMDYTFIQGMLGSITTYLVILIQMSSSYVPNTSNSIINDTKIAGNLSDI